MLQDGSTGPFSVVQHFLHHAAPGAVHSLLPATDCNTYRLSWTRDKIQTWSHLSSAEIRTSELALHDGTSQMITEMTYQTCRKSDLVAGLKKTQSPDSLPQGDLYSMQFQDFCKS